jgi:hypothetical protein
MPSYVVLLITMPGCLLALAVVLAVFRARKEDLPEMVRAIMRRKGGGDGPPSLPMA